MTDPQDGTPGLAGPTPDASIEAAPAAIDPQAPSADAAASAETRVAAEPPPESVAAPETLVSGRAPQPGAAAPEPHRPTFLFFGVVAAISLIADVSTKAWAEITLTRRSPLLPPIEIIKDHLAFVLAYNKGGAWGLFQNQSEAVRRPFFLLVSLLAIAFIINLYGRLTPGQRALKWGLPLVLGGALGNLSDRIVRSNVIDFIDYQAKWIESMNRIIAKPVKGWAITDHWPTFNVADIAICVGVGLMAVDMFTSRRGATASVPPRPPADGGRPVTPDADPAGDQTGSGLNVTEATPPLKPDA